MKMVDGSTVRHGRVDCSYPETASECRGQSHRHTGAVGGNKRVEERGDSNEERGKRKKEEDKAGE